ncbi:MAG: hypothetical protein M1839_002036 [Geoglossum umbratile]|nr:MAG: hypothetical protein M1839_002036 [Geoglossum umbratile]
MAAGTNGYLVESPMPIKKGRHNPRSRKLQNRRKGLAARTLSICARYSSIQHLLSILVLVEVHFQSRSRYLRFHSTYQQLSRLATWFILATVAFKCPSSPAELTDASSRMCRTYLDIRSQFTPYLEPYYDVYAAPYVNTARPYIEKIDTQFVAPVFGLGRQSYENYCAPRVGKVREYGLRKWQNTVWPRLEATTGKAWERYNTHLASHVSKAIAVSTPYYELARDNLLLTYYSHLVPAYTSSIPYIEGTYAYGRGFAVHTGIPYAKGVWRGTTIFVDRILWLKVRVLYGENVEPQLVRIGQRLGSYRNGKRIRTAADQADSSSQSPSTPPTPSPTSPAAATHTTPSAIRSSPPSGISDETRATPMTDEEIAREKVTEDLRAWHAKFSKAAEKGAEDLEDRVREITEGQISRHAQGVGQTLVVQLEETVKNEIRKLKTKIVDIVKAIPPTAAEEDIENAEGALLGAIRTAGLAMKEKAVALRTWKYDYFEETDRLVASATEATVEVLDNIRDLGLQEIGMRWAWMEGVTYKDWSEYHALRKTFDEWRDEVEAAAKKHQGLAKAKEVGDDVEGRGMVVAEEAAAELRRLKQVAKWKIDAQDPSPNFDIKHAPAAAVKVGQKILKKAKDAVSGAPHAASESAVSQATSKIDAASSISQDVPLAISEAALGTEPSVVAAEFPEALPGSEQPKVESIVSAPSRKARGFASDASEAIIGTPPPFFNSFDSIAPERVECAASAISEGIHGKEPPPSFPDNFSLVANAGISKESLLSSTDSKKVWGGASAQQVDARQIVYEASERVSGSETPFTESVISKASSYGTIASEKLFGSEVPLPESIISRAGSYGAVATDGTAERYEAVRALISELVSGKEPDFTESVMNRLSSVYQTGAPEVMSSASSMASEAYEAASSVVTSIYTPPPELEAILDSASEKINSAIGAVSNRLYGTPKGTYEQATSAASEAYESISSHVSGAIYGTPTGYVEAAQSSVSEVFASAQSAISVAIYGTEKGYVEQVTSAASKAYDSASSAAASSISAASSVIEENVSAARAHVSEAVYGTPQGVVESAQSRLSEAIYGPQIGALESAQSRLNAAVESSRARLNEFVESADEAAGQAISAVRENVQSMASQVSSAAGSAATKAGLHDEL